MPVTLKAIDLLDRGGFLDGDLLEDLLYVNGYDDLDDILFHIDGPSFESTVLAECIRRHLAPLLIGFEIEYDVCALHNPVRIVCETRQDAARMRPVLEGIEVTLTDKDVLFIAAEVSKTFRKPVTAQGAILPGWSSRI